MEPLADDLTQMRRTPLSLDHVAATREIATIRNYSPGQYILPAGEAADRFVYVLEGEVEAVDTYTEQRLMKGTIGPTQFVGDIAFLSGTKVTLPMRAVQATQTFEVPRVEMLQLMTRVPEMSDIIISVMAARRRMQLEVHASSLKVVGAGRDPSLQKIVAFADRNKIPYVAEELGNETTPDQGPDAGRQGATPAVIFGKDQLVEEPTPRKIADLLGLDQGVSSGDAFDLLIVGSGPAGVAAGVYAGAEGLSALLVDDIAIGGQAGTSSRIENYMGFPTGISGADLAWRGYIQALKFGTQFAVPPPVHRHRGKRRWL
ncbi:cyclic nucleotide-binding domain-containing protein [Ruegeria sp. SCPT10]|uniref:cyclic nucleotide-binding domain-containing protein n=1 Tax=Ruegeria sp. SCP10 TaxID=3141377 RepID=UPI00333C5FF5